MITPQKVTDWFQKYYDKYDAQLYAIPVPKTDPLQGLVGDEQNALQGLADITAAAVNHPPTGNEADPDYPAKYQSVLDAIEHIRRFVGYQIEGYGK